MPTRLLISKKIGENIEHIRLGKKKTIKEIANFLKLTDCGYRNIERGITEITVSKLFLIANFLNVPCSILLNFSEQESTSNDNNQKNILDK